MTGPSTTENQPPARIHFLNGRAAEVKDQQLAHQIWLSLPRGLRAAFRGKGDNRPVYAWGYTDKH